MRITYFRSLFVSLFLCGAGLMAGQPGTTSLWDGSGGVRGWERWSRLGPEEPSVRVFEGTPPEGESALVIEFPRTGAEQTIGRELASFPPAATTKISFWLRPVFGSGKLDVCLIVKEGGHHSYVARLKSGGGDWEKVELKISDFKAETKDAPPLDVSRVDRILFRTYKNGPFAYALGSIEAVTAGQ